MRLPERNIARDGKFWFPTQEGVAVVDPEAVYLNPQAPPVLIEAVTLERTPVDFQRGVTIQPGQRDLEISYTGLSYIKSEQIQFKYKLEGLRADWVDAGTRRVAYFPYLPPGSYTFRVIAANSDGVWNNEGAIIKVMVHAPFWQRVWFWLLCAGSVIVIAAIAVRSRIAQLKRKQAEREAFSRRLIQSQEGERKRADARRQIHDGVCRGKRRDDPRHRRQDLSYPHPGSRMFDELGNEYMPSQLQIGSDTNETLARLVLVPNVPVKASIRFDNVNTQALKAKVLRLACQTRRPCECWKATHQEQPTKTRTLRREDSRARSS